VSLAFAIAGEGVLMTGEKRLAPGEISLIREIAEKRTHVPSVKLDHAVNDLVDKVPH
jgi:hypothetical protein